MGTTPPPQASQRAIFSAEFRAQGLGGQQAIEHMKQAPQGKLQDLVLQGLRPQFDGRASTGRAKPDRVCGQHWSDITELEEANEREDAGFMVVFELPGPDDVDGPVRSDYERALELRQVKNTPTSRRSRQSGQGRSNSPRERGQDRWIVVYVGYGRHRYENNVGDYRQTQKELPPGSICA